VSARYTKLAEEFYVPHAAVYGVQSQTNKQKRDFDDAVGSTIEQLRQAGRWQNEQREHVESTFALYRKHLAEGMPRELARIVLPFAAYSRMFATVNLLNLLRFLTLRTADDAQWEIREYAKAAEQLAETVAPVALVAWRGSAAKDKGGNSD
jgi:thymidylate synthase (FAD)